MTMMLGEFVRPHIAVIVDDHLDEPVVMLAASLPELSRMIALYVYSRSEEHGLDLDMPDGCLDSDEQAAGWLELHQQSPDHYQHWLIELYGPPEEWGVRERLPGEPKLSGRYETRVSLLDIIERTARCIDVEALA